MRITSFQITVQPWYADDTLMELRIEVIANGIKRTHSVPFVANDFESVFDFLMKEAQRKVVEIVKISNPTEKG